MLLDGNSLAFRAFYALPAENFKTQGGLTTNAVYGFTAMLINLLRDEQPTPHRGGVRRVPADVPARRSTRSTRRAGRRRPTSSAARSTSPRRCWARSASPCSPRPGFEADDIIATLATQAENEGYRVLVVTGDRDALQLVSDDVTVLYPRKGVSELTRFTPEAVVEKYGLTPTQYPDFAALRGDPSDNLPGIPGRGGEDGDEVDRRVRLAAGAGRQRRQGQGQGRRCAARPPVQRHAQPRSHRAGQGRAAGADARHAADAAVGPRPDPPPVRRPRVPGAARPAVRHAGLGGPRGRGGLRRARRSAGAGQLAAWLAEHSQRQRFGLAVVGTHLAFDADATALAIVAADGDGRYIDTAAPGPRTTRPRWRRGSPTPTSPKALHEAKLAMHDLAGRGWTLAGRHLGHRAGGLPGPAGSAQLRARRPVAAVSEAGAARGQP